MLIKGKTVGLVVEFFKLTVEPMREGGVDPFNRFSHCPPARRCAAAASLVWDSKRDPFVERGREQRRLSIPRMPYSCDMRRIDIAVPYQIVHAPMVSPRPCRKRAAIGGIIAG